ncbi:unnamed protein product [Caenorhabditis auriculariae]|uniref:Uncharacterized protein n=1 Tax=Caenorhabditis auriculariae TaxID=2777116 RepID=A0A8S1HKW6_9PELO|nr:unnamed protein product [Caenorhabditis auriculariae]
MGSLSRRLVQAQLCEGRPVALPAPDHFPGLTHKPAFEFPFGTCSKHAQQLFFNRSTNSTDQHQSLVFHWRIRLGYKMSASGSNTIADIYRSVISDVINQVKEAFLDENVDVDILSQLKKEWEDKVNSSGCVELEAPLRPQHVAPPPMRVVNQIPQTTRMSIPTTARLQPVQQQNLMQEQRLQMQYTQPPQQQQQQMGSFQIQQHIAPQQMNQIRMLSQIPGQQYVIANSNGQPIHGQVMIVQNVNGQHVPVTIGPNGVIQQQPQRIIQQSQLSHQNIHQLDGNGDVSEQTPVPLKKSARRAQKKAKDEEAVKVLSGLLKCVQLDGGGGGMSDSSSEDEDIEEEDDPLRRIADRIGDGEVEDGDQIAEEDPLNSDDDQSDDEDLSILFDAENVVMCQFEKVNRARTKWRFQLKDGIMHIDNKDYCFQKCSGEAEW